MNKRKSKSEWMELVKEFKASNLNLTTWCRQEGICKTTIYPYIKILDNNQTALSEEQQWGKLSLPKSASNSAISIKVGSITLSVNSGFDKEVLSEVLRVAMNLC
jgi:hypothetical protein